MAASDATVYPRKNVAYRVTFPIFDADGDLVTGAAGLDSEVSKDGGTFADATSEATEIATSSGMYYLDLTATEMNADTVAIIVKTSTTGAKTTPIVLYPYEDTDLRVDVQRFGGTAGTFASGRPEVNTTHLDGTSGAGNAAADALLKRDWTSVTGEATRSVLNALRFLRNKWSLASTTLTVTKEDDTTSAWTATVTTDAGAAPITSADPT